MSKFVGNKEKKRTVEKWRVERAGHLEHDLVLVDAVPGGLGHAAHLALEVDLLARLLEVELERGARGLEDAQGRVHDLKEGVGSLTERTRKEETDRRGRR